jgi:hypothetical protein
MQAPSPALQAIVAADRAARREQARAFVRAYPDRMRSSTAMTGAFSQLPDMVRGTIRWLGEDRLDVRGTLVDSHGTVIPAPVEVQALAEGIRDAGEDAAMSDDDGAGVVVHRRLMSGRRHAIGADCWCRPHLLTPAEVRDAAATAATLLLREARGDA